MAYYGVLFVIASFSICRFVYAAGIVSALGSTKFTNIAGLTLDAFDLGVSIYDNTATTASAYDKQEILGKIDTVQTTVYVLQQTVVDLFFQLQLQLKLEKVEDFDRSTKNRIRDSENAINSTTADKTHYLNIFLENSVGYLDKLYEIIPYVTTKSISTEKQILEMIREKTNCHLTKMGNFSAYIHNLVLSGIGIETMYKKKKYSGISLALEKTFWGTELKTFETAVAAQTKNCTDQFKTLFEKDIQLINETLSSIMSTIEGRYPDKMFFVVDLNGLVIENSNLTTDTFRCIVYNNDGSCKKRCFIYHTDDIDCEKMVAFKIYGKEYKYLKSDRYPMTLTVDENNHLFRPTNCEEWDKISKSYDTPSPVQLPSIPDLPICGSRKNSWERHIAILALIVVAVAC
ncbi:hypothetical protein DPMN_148407 [Dreissena polymorpha]|uniref:Uncharacterized protein n=1 Tax=Dreissena polymorpha TaxID=45954 RepID=A0A9D4J3V0_DREPO|nr:hypothetical protein DPMN_148407 [Dreissena polymorpha]